MEEKETKLTEEVSENKTETPTKSNRDTFMERYRTDYPDDNAEDEEVVYGRLNERNAEYDRLKKDDDNFRKLVNEHPQYAAMFIDAGDGVNFMQSFLSRFSKDDLLAAYDDPEMAKKLADQQAEYLKSQEDSKKLKEEGDVNIQDSLRRFTEYCDKNGIDNKDATEMWGKMIDMVSDGLKGKFTDNLFDTVRKATTHDADVENARAEGELAGHNAKVQTTLAKGRDIDGIPPTFDGGQGGVVPEEKPREKVVRRNPFRGEDQEF
jgi:hypothetical protein